MSRGLTVYERNPLVRWVNTRGRPIIRAYRLAGEVQNFDQFLFGAILVHGSIQAAGKPRIRHAWLEYPEDKDGPQVFEPISEEVFPRDLFYAMFSAQAHRRYSVEEAREKFRRYKHWGPWEKAEDGNT